MSKKTLVDFFVQRLQRIVDTPPEDQDWVEGAKFMGMIERIDPNHPILAQAAQSLASEKAKAICAFAEINVEDIVDALVGAVASDEQHTFDLFTLDSLCAAAYVLGCTHLLHDELRLVLLNIMHQPPKVGTRARHCQRRIGTGATVEGRSCQSLLVLD